MLGGARMSVHVSKFSRCFQMFLEIWIFEIIYFITVKVENLERCAMI